MMTAGLIAGEPIQFSNGKSRSEPPSQDRLSKEKLAPLERVTSVNPNDEVDSSRYLSRRRDPKEEKRRKLDELERKNWMVVDKGELQAKEEEETSFGIRDYDADSLEKDKTATDIWFGPKEHNNKGTKGPNQARSLSRNSVQNRPPPPPPDSEDKSSELNFGKLTGKEAESQTGGPTKELSLKAVMGPDQTDTSSRELFGPGSGGPGLFEERGRRREELGFRSVDTQPGAAELPEP
jgi:hypothetical protein